MVYDYSGHYDVQTPFGSGVLRLYRTGNRYCADMTAPLPDCPLHLYCISGGQAVCLGVPVPEGNGKVRLKRRLDPFIFSPLGGKIELCILAPRGYDSHLDPDPSGRHDAPPILPSGWQETSQQVYPALPPGSGAIECQYKGRIFLALPLRHDSPFPLPALMKRGVPIKLGSRKYLLFRLNGRRIAAAENTDYPLSADLY